MARNGDEDRYEVLDKLRHKLGGSDPLSFSLFYLHRNLLDEVDRGLKHLVFSVRSAKKVATYQLEVMIGTTRPLLLPIRINKVSQTPTRQQEW